MFLSNIYLFRFTKPFEITADELNDKLKELLFKEPGPQEMSRSGFVPPEMMRDDYLVRSVDGRLQLTLRTDTKKIPGPVVKAMVKERVEALEQEQDRKVRSKEKAEIKEQVIMELLPNTFPQPSLTTGYFDCENGLLVVGEGSAKKAENFASTIRKVLGSLPVRPIAFEQSPTFTLTGMLNGSIDFGDKFAAGHKVVLKDPAESKCKVSIDNLDLFSEEVQKHLETGMQVAKIDLIWNDQIRFSTDTLSIKGIKFEEDLNEQLDDIEGDERSYYDAMFSLYVTTITEMIDDFIEWMGGEDRTAILEEDA